MTTTLILSGIIAAISIVVIITAVWLMTRSAATQPRSEAKAATLSDYESVERAAMPEEIASGSLVISEQTLHRKGNRPLAAKTDQVFRTQWGLLVPVETKTRKRLYASDIVQLSCQAVALADHGTVTDYGYIRLVVPGRTPDYQKVKHLSASEIDRLWDRYQALRLRKATPIPRPATHRCSQCAFRKGCSSAPKENRTPTTTFGKPYRRGP